MRQRSRVRLASLVVAAGALIGAVQAKPDPRPPCCFTHPRYVGVCEVKPAKDETCETILAYLNNPLAQGKAYCNNTTLRGGWEEAACGKAKGKQEAE
jgi:hypothetical protein